ncbi:hypothetical protein AVEN_241813-1 [Araneus ventricosus]|uniref:Uncharacterized protein n=1 Tax=Araneus ventricosus TaxID=182803 RepID=A0A4Y2UKJ1_ARAVE|nr:hypothetical protein AVEN_241813-1 [Araneus ventricosus]
MWSLKGYNPQKCLLNPKVTGSTCRKGEEERGLLSSILSHQKKKRNRQTERLSGVENRWETKCLPQIVNQATNLKEQIKRKRKKENLRKEATTA